MGKETEFSRRVRRALKQGGCAVYPVETGSTVGGFPDLVVLHQGGASFIELKSRTRALASALSSEALLGPGQGAFAKTFARRSLWRSKGVSVSSHTFLLVECMDGVALLVLEKDSAYLAACWESLPSGADLRDSLVAWRLRCSPSHEQKGTGMLEAFNLCADAYESLTGVLVPREGFDGGRAAIDGAEDAAMIGRDICDRARLGLLARSIRDERGMSSLVPMEDNGFIKIVK